MAKKDLYKGVWIREVLKNNEKRGTNYVRKPGKKRTEIRGRKRTVFLENNRRKDQEVVHEEKVRREDTGTPARISRKGMRRTKVAYTNIDGFLSSKVELEHYLKRDNPDIICIVETKLRSDTQVHGINEGRYKV